MKNYEKESLLKNFLVFFFLLELLLILLFIEIYHAEKKDYKQRLYQTMQVCSYTMNCPQFIFDFVPKDKTSLSVIHENSEVYAYFPIPSSKEFQMQIVYSKKEFQKDLEEIRNRLLMKFIFLTFLLFIISLLFTWYTLAPIRKALKINNEFVKDILHDFNTPITSMVLNIKMLQEEAGKNHFVERISYGIDTIMLLQNNLKSFLHHSPSQLEMVNIVKLSRERLTYIKNLYPKLTFDMHTHNTLDKLTNRELLTRILDNLLSNAAKYNKRGGKVTLTIIAECIKIEDTGKGIADIKKVRDRYYKEQARGLGLGLSIVDKLTSELNIRMSIQSVKGEGTTILLDLQYLKEEST